METTIRETTVGFLGGQVVPMASMVFEGDYALPDGSNAKGLACILVFGDDGGTWVGLGSVVTIGGQRFECVAIEKERGKLGSVTMKALDA